MSCCLKINIKGDLRTVSYLYNENVGEANKFFCKIQKLVQPSSPNTIIGHFEDIYIFLITSIQSQFILFLNRKNI